MRTWVKPKGRLIHSLDYAIDMLGSHMESKKVSTSFFFTNTKSSNRCLFEKLIVYFKYYTNLQEPDAIDISFTRDEMNVLTKGELSKPITFLKDNFPSLRKYLTTDAMCKVEKESTLSSVGRYGSLGTTTITI